MNAKQSLFSAFEEGGLAGKTATEILKILNIPYREKKRLTDLLDELVEEGRLFQNDGGRYGTMEQLGLIKGTLRGHERGFAFLVPEDKDAYPNDFFIPHVGLHGALHGDTVLIERVFSRSDDEGAVVKILERGYPNVVGTFRRDRRAGVLIPDEKKLATEIYIPLSACANIPNHVKAVAKITSYPHGKCPGGEIVEVLGDEEDFFAEELSIIRSYGLREEFPPKVEREANRQAARLITEEEISKRRDLREKIVVTIDGADTRDIDDAVSLEKDGDEYLLGVHIADVSHYVAYRSPLDLEAYERGTSVYFPDRVLPMLPKALSNGICSLNEGEDRLALSCLMRIDGGFTDNFIVQVSSKSLQAIEASVADGILDIGATTSITTAFTPKNAPNKQLRYEVVEGAKIVSVNSQGVVTGLGVGEATIRVISRFNEEIYSEVKVEVTSSAAVQFVTHSVTNTMQQTGGAIPLYIGEGVDFTYELEVLDGAGNATDEAITYALDSENKVLSYTFREGFEGRVTLKLTVRVEGVDPFVDECTITRIRQIEASWVGAKSIAIKVGTTQYVYLEVNPSDVEIGYEISYENDQGYISVEEDVENGQLIITAVRAAEDFGESYTDVVLKIWATNNPEQVITLTLTVNIYH